MLLSLETQEKVGSSGTSNHVVNCLCIMIGLDYEIHIVLLVRVFRLVIMLRVLGNHQ